MDELGTGQNAAKLRQFSPWFYAPEGRHSSASGGAKRNPGTQRPSREGSSARDHPKRSLSPKG